MRLFVAVELGQALSERAAALSRELQRRAADLAPRAKITWIPAERLHLTIRFIGEVDDHRAAAIHDSLAPPLPIAPFEMTLAGAGAFPRRGAPRVLWAGVADGKDRLLALEGEVSARLAPLGLAEEARPYSPHLTLARVREAGGLRTVRLLEGLTAHPVGATRVDAITLFQSRLSPKGPTYAPLMHTPCAP